MFTNYYANLTLNHYFRSRTVTSWLAMFTADPTVLGHLDDEVVGGGYARQQITWSEPGSKTVVNVNALVFDNLPAAIVPYFAVMDAGGAGHVMNILPLEDELTFASGNRYLIPAGDLAMVI